MSYQSVITIENGQTSTGLVAATEAAGGSAASIIVNNGGTLNEGSVKTGGTVTAYTGATLNTLSAEAGTVTISGATVNATSVGQNGRLNVSANGSVTNAALSENGRLDVRNGSLHTATVTNGGFLAVWGANASADDIYVSGAYGATKARLSALVGGHVTNVDIYTGGILEVGKDGSATVSDARIHSAGEFVLYNGKVYDVEINSGGSAIIKGSKGSAGTVSGANIAAGAVVKVSSGGILNISGADVANGVNLLTSAQMVVSNGATAADLNITGSVGVAAGTFWNLNIDGGKVDGGTATGSAKGNAICLQVINGGELKNYTLTAADNVGQTIWGFIGQTGEVAGSAYNVTVESRTRLDARQGGVISSATVRDGSLMVIWGGTLRDAKVSGIQDGIKATVSAQALTGTKGVVSGAEIGDGGYLKVDNGGQISGVDVKSGGEVAVLTGGTVTGANVASGAIFNVSSGAVLNISGTDVASGVNLLTSARMVVSNGATAADLNITGDVAVAAGTFWNLNVAGGKVSGGVATGSAKANAICIKAVSGGEISDFTFTAGDAANQTIWGFIGYNGEAAGSAYNITIESRVRVDARQGGVISGATVRNGANMYAWGGTIYDVKASGIQDDVKARISAVYMGTTRGIVSGAELGSGGYLEVGNGGYASKVDVKTSGGITVLTGGSADNVNVSGDTHLDGNNPVYALNVNGGRVSGGVATGYGNQTYAVFVQVTGGGLLEDYTFTAEDATGIQRVWAIVTGTGVGSKLTVDSLCMVDARNGGKISGATVKNGAILDVRGGTAYDVTADGALSGGKARVSARQVGAYQGVISGAEIGDGGYLEVMSGGYVSKADIKTGGYMKVLANGSADNVNVSGAGAGDYYLIVDGGKVSGGAMIETGDTYGGLNFQVIKGGELRNYTITAEDPTGVYRACGYIGWNGTAAGYGWDLTVENRCRLDARQGGVISGATVRSGAEMVMWGGSAYDVVAEGLYNNANKVHLYVISRTTDGGLLERATVGSGAYLEIGDGGVGSQITLTGDASAYVSSGGVLTDINAAAGGKIIVSSSGVVNVSATNVLNNIKTVAGAQVNFVEHADGVMLQGASTNIAASTFYYNGATQALGFKATNGVVTNLGADGNIYRLSVGDDIVVNDAVVTDNCRISGFGGAVLNRLSISGKNAAASVVLTENAKSYDAVLTGSNGKTTLLAISANVVAYDTVVNSGGTLRFNGTSAYASGTVVNSGGKIEYNTGMGGFGHIEDTTLKAGAILTLSDTADTGEKLTLDFTGTTGNQSLTINNLGLVSSDTRIAAQGLAIGTTYTIASTGSTDRYVCCDAAGLYDNAVQGGTTYTNAFAGKTWNFSTGKSIAVTEFSIGEAKTTAGAITTADTALNTNDRAAKWDATTSYTDSVTLADSTLAGDAWLEIDGTNVSTALYGASGNYAHTVNIEAKSGEIRNLAAGAGNGGSVAGVKLTLDGADVTGAAYAGGFGTVTGKTETLISDGSFSKDFYAGALANYAKTSTVTTVGDIALTVAGGEFSGNIYGASAVKSSVAGVHTAGDVTLTVENGSTTKGNQACIFAGGYATGDATGTVYTVDSVTATISGGSWGTAAGGRGVFGGVMASGVTAQAGDVNLTISGDATMGNVYGGGWAQKTNGKSIVGDVNINIAGGTIANVFGGGSHSTSGGSTEAGDITITVSGGDITGAIYAKGQLDGDTTGAAKVIFTGAADFDCDVFGYSYVGGAASDATLSFNGYIGGFAGAIGGFDSITFTDGAAMTLATAAADISNGKWEFDLTARGAELAGTSLLTWSAADFTNDTIAVTFADETQAKAGWNIATVAEAFSGTTFDLTVGETEITGLAYKQEIASGDYAGWGFDLESGTLKFKQLA